MGSQPLVSLDCLVIGTDYVWHNFGHCSQSQINNDTVSVCAASTGVRPWGWGSVQLAGMAAMPEEQQRQFHLTTFHML